MDPVSHIRLTTPELLQTLAFNVQDSKGNNLLHRFVLDNSDPNEARSENYVTAVLRSMCYVSANALNDDGYSALHMAVQKNNLLMVKKLLSCLVNIEVDTRCSRYEKDSAFLLAVKLRHFSLVPELLDKGADVDLKDRYGSTALCFVSRHLDIMKLLVSKGAKVNPKGAMESPLHFAAFSGNLAAVEYLVNNGAALNAINTYGRSPLSTAARSGNLAIVECLVNNGADVNDQMKIYRTVLHYAPNCPEMLQILQFLVGNCADVYVKGTHDPTPLHYAVCSGSLEIVAFLVGKGADLDAVDNDGKTPLQRAIYKNNLEIVSLLHEAVRKV